MPPDYKPNVEKRKLVPSSSAVLGNGDDYEDAQRLKAARRFKRGHRRGQEADERLQVRSLIHKRHDLLAKIFFDFAACYSPQKEQICVDARCARFSLLDII